MKRLLSAGMSRIYQCCKVYRREELGALHQPEFTMLEWYRAFAGMQEMILDTEALVFFVVSSLRGGRTSLPVRTPEPQELDITPPWERLSVREAFERYADRALDRVLPDEALFHRVLAEQIEPQLGQHRPTVLTHYPAAMASLARLCPQDPTVAERFEVYVRGVELCNGFGELADDAEQRARLQADLRARRAHGRREYPLDERFLAALADGIPPSGGNALGFDRLVMLALGADAIDEVVAFPAQP
jgi:lysyl-tRNA synthetase class 2